MQEATRAYSLPEHEPQRPRRAAPGPKGVRAKRDAELRARIRDHVRQHPGVSQLALTRALGESRRAVTARVRELRSTGDVRVYRHGECPVCWPRRFL